MFKLRFDPSGAPILPTFFGHLRLLLREHLLSQFGVEEIHIELLRLVILVVVHRAAVDQHPGAREPAVRPAHDADFLDVVLLDVRQQLHEPVPLEHLVRHEEAGVGCGFEAQQLGVGRHTLLPANSQNELFAFEVNGFAVGGSWVRLAGRVLFIDFGLFDGRLAKR